MPVGKRQLSVWTGGDAVVSPSPSAGIPLIAQVAYTHPNPDGTRKNCANCSGWVREQSCMVHPPDILIPPDAICAHHIFGEPRAVRGLEHNRVQFLDPVLSGLEQIPGGSSCDRCRWYDPATELDGTCRAVDMEGGALAVVEARARCARWERS